MQTSRFQKHPSMQKESFEVAIEGTTLKDLAYYDTSKKIVVVDSEHNYGTTYNSLRGLSSSKYIENLEIGIAKESEKGIKLQYLIESLPFLLGSHDSSVKKFKNKAMGEEMEYVPIKDIFYISKTQTRLPLSKNDILKMNLCDEDRFYLYKALRTGNPDLLREHFTDRNNPVFEALAAVRVFSTNELEKISKGLGSNVFLYPVHGISEISESVCFSNSFNGTTYVLNDTLECTENNEDGEHGYVFQCDLGTLHTKEFVRQQLTSGNSYVRVILATKQKFNGVFLAFVSSEEDSFLMDMEPEDVEQKRDAFVKVIGLDSTAEVCNEGLQLLYFIKKYSKVEDREIKRLQLVEQDILVDISFTAKYDLNQFEQQLPSI